MHIEDTITAFVEKFKKQGHFNQVRFADLRMEASEHYPDEQSKEEFEAHRHNYAIFVCEFESPELEDPNPYTHTEWDEHQLKRDFAESIMECFNEFSDVTVTIHKSEFEVIRNTTTEQ